MIFFKVDNKRYKELLIKIETEKCDKVLFVVDADDVKNDVQYGGYNNTKTKLTNALNALSIKNRDIYIMSDPTTKIGYLESLILSTISGNERKCIDDFLKCSEFKDKKITRRYYTKFIKLPTQQNLMIFHTQILTNYNKN